MIYFDCAARQQRCQITPILVRGRMVADKEASCTELSYNYLSLLKLYYIRIKRSLCLGCLVERTPRPSRNRAQDSVILICA